MTHDPVNRPSHYAEGRQYEPIAVIEDWSLGYHLGNALKYISRAGRKQNTIEDLRKAVWYVNREIDRLEGDTQEEEAAQTFLAEDLYEQIAWADACGVLWDPSTGPIEPPEDCIHAAQPVDFTFLGGAGQDTISLEITEEEKEHPFFVPDTPVGIETSARPLYEDPFH